MISVLPSHVEPVEEGPQVPLNFVPPPPPFWYPLLSPTVFRPELKDDARFVFGGDMRLCAGAPVLPKRLPPARLCDMSENIARAQIFSFLESRDLPGEEGEIVIGSTVTSSPIEKFILRKLIEKVQFWTPL